MFWNGLNYDKFHGVGISVHCFHDMYEKTMATELIQVKSDFIIHWRINVQVSWAFFGI